MVVVDRQRVVTYECESCGLHDVRRRRGRARRYFIRLAQQKRMHAVHVLNVEGYMLGGVACRVTCYQSIRSGSKKRNVDGWRIFS